ncbi:GNAT family N-acetyltransferase [Brevibacterium sp. JNUCC-42]|uniref:N-acetyltransferase n=1 Tax=Brevibacillus laterosporus TaxID=1465 RepID=A0A502I9Q1_BRELA|nr:GNAT family protein [Brevibacillus laterosporus]QOT00441.1 GNAT family N-acetyltransferase [Brevibacterium sp. JNUCC-42]QDX93947.1 N-acetyltransferase [Brevibacillus laterosporus]RAP22544.1 hypothetical protein C2W64_03532 [Brevibacillus laterosporus]TPG67893.1 N-acetyltransferase [Brevibacillus laterosporus]TPG83679.1 N-acetyltransferase [Brevibacillus laterosporus]
MNNDRTFPKLETERLILRQLQPSDAPAMFHYFSKDEVMKYYDLETFTELQQAENIISQFGERYQAKQGIRWGITRKTDDVVIGTCGYHNVNKEHSKAEIGYELSPEFWQQGIMSEAIQAIVAFGFAKWNLNRIEAFIDPENEGSRRLLTKTGLREEGLLKEYFFEKGNFVDAVIFAILRKEFITDN